MDLETMTIFGRSRQSNGAFLYQSVTDLLTEKEKSIQEALADERRKFVRNRNNKIRADKVMPVTNVITHIRRRDEPAYRDERIDRLGDRNEIAIQGNTCGRVSENKRTTGPDNKQKEMKSCKECPGGKASINKQCKCCGISLTSNESNKTQCCPAYTSLDGYKYPSSSVRDSRSQYDEIEEYDAFSRNVCRETLENHGDQDIDREEYTTVNTYRKNFHPAKDVIDLKNSDKILTIVNNEGFDKSYADWKNEARNILLEIGSNIKIVNGVEKRYNFIRNEELASCYLSRWKQYTENKKIMRNKIEKVKYQMEMKLVRNCFIKWKRKVDIKRKEKVTRAEKIDAFLNVLRFKQLELKKEEKGKDNMKKFKKTIDSKNEFINRLNTQKNIILSQKKKLAQAEEDMREMKLKNILEQSKASRNVVVENVKETIRHIDPQLKVAAHQIISLRHDKIKTDDKAKLLVESMERRAKERKQKWEQIQERKKQKAEDMVKALQEQEAKKLEEEEEKKRRKIDELKEKRRKDRENAIKMENERRRRSSLTIIAENFYKKKLKQKALRALRENLRNSEIKMDLAEKYYIYQLKRKFFVEWRFYAEEIITKKIHLAAHFYDFILKRRVLDCFKELYNTKVLNLQVAVDFRELKLQERYFSKWKQFCLWRHQMVNLQMRDAHNFYMRKLLVRCFLQWKSLPEIAFYEREKDKRLREWRDKVKEVLPDFVPFDVD